MRTLIFLPLLALLAGCGDDLSSFQGIAEAKASAHEDLADVFDSIKDKASVEAAAPKIKAIQKRIDEADQAMTKIAAMPNEKEFEKYGKKVAAAQTKLEKARADLMNRLMRDKEAMEAFDKAIG